MIPHDKAMAFILGGKAEFTVYNPETRQRIHVRIRYSETYDTYTVYMEEGWVARIRNRDKELIRINKEITNARRFSWFYHQLQQGTLPPQIQILHNGHCGVCGRELTDPESILSGIGPVCRGRVATLFGPR